jgi:hypothetical protein
MVPARGRSTAKRPPTPGRRSMLPRWPVRFQGDRLSHSLWTGCVHYGPIDSVRRVRHDRPFQPFTLQQ